MGMFIEAEVKAFKKKKAIVEIVEVMQTLVIVRLECESYSFNPLKLLMSLHQFVGGSTGPRFRL